MGLGRTIVCWCAMLALVALAAPAEETKLAKPLRLPPGIQKSDKSRLNGTVTSYDEDGFSLNQPGGKEPLHIAWADLDARGQYAVRQSIIAAAQPKDAKAYLELGRQMLQTADGKAYADKAFAIAVRLDPKLKDEAAAAAHSANSAKMETGEKSQTTAVEAGPRLVGQVQSKFWGKQSEEEQAAHIKVLRAFAEESARQLNRPLRLSETRYFLFYCDLPPREASKWAGLLDKMYDRLAELFALSPGDNLWRGKALVLVFTQPEDYQRFEKECHKTNAAGTAGMCHSFGDGSVHIAFYRQPVDLEFAHVLVHESVHGFLHRYKTPVPIPSWANEGLAEVIAQELVPQPGRPQRSKELARSGVMQHGGVGGLFETQRIDAWQYPVAQQITEFMILQNKRNYVDFVNAIKDGMTWSEALDQKYKAPKDRLERAYIEWLGVKLPP